MSSVVDIEYRKPLAESVTVKLTRNEAQDLIAAYEELHKRERYFFNIWGRTPDLVDQVKRALGQKVTPQPALKSPIDWASMSPVMTTNTAR